jgi:hypothetical protein
MRLTTIGLLVGLFLGLVWAWMGFAEMLLVAFCGAVGFFVMKVVEGEVDVAQYLDNLNRRRR